MIKVKIGSYDELKNKDWFVEDMKIYCGMETTINRDVDADHVYLNGCGRYVFGKDGFKIMGYVHESIEREWIVVLGKKHNTSVEYVCPHCAFASLSKYSFAPKYCSWCGLKLVEGKGDEEE